MVVAATEDGEGPGGQQAVEAPGLCPPPPCVCGPRMSLFFQILRRSSVGDLKGITLTPPCTPQPPSFLGLVLVSAPLPCLSAPLSLSLSSFPASVTPSAGL